MSVRNTIIQSINYSIEQLNNLKNIVHRKAVIELDEILLDDFIELGANILNNIEFQTMIINKYGPYLRDETNPMTNEDLLNYFRQNWDLLVDIDSIIIDPHLFLT